MEESSLFNMSSERVVMPVIDAILVKQLTQVIVNRLFDQENRRDFSPYNSVINSVTERLQSEIPSRPSSACSSSSFGSVLRDLLKSRKAGNFVKGETYVDDFLRVLNAVPIDSSLVYAQSDVSFVDLGSGDGECLLAAAICNSDRLRFAHIVGYEVNHARVVESRVLISVIQELYSTDDVVLPSLLVLEKDFLTDEDWLPSHFLQTEAENSLRRKQIYLIYACATCYTPDVVNGIYLKCKKLAASSHTVFLILMDKDLPSIVNCSDSNTAYPPFVQIGENFINVRTSWGEGTICIYEIL
jgi:hypothetical protein